jgi:hypothetical protein
MFLPGMGAVLKLEPVSPGVWGGLLALSLLLLAAMEAFKLARGFRRRDGGSAGGRMVDDGPPR